MRCSACTGSTHVLDTRAGADTIRRRRECVDCGERFTTYERADLAADELERTVIAYVRGLDPAPTTQEATR